MVEVGKAAIVRFPGDHYGGKVRVAEIRAYRGDQALVARWRGPNASMYRRWARPGWVPAADIAREASAREAVVGLAIDPVPPRTA